MHGKFYVIAGGLALLWFLEAAFPLFESFVAGKRRWISHDSRNLAMGLGNAALGAAGLVWLTGRVAAFAELHHFGLLRVPALPALPSTLLMLLLFDLWMYAWHRLNHALPLFWRFHRMHHSDPAMDASSALRFHPGEVLLSGFFRLPVVAVLGMSLPQLALYEWLLFPVILVHHSNVAMPRRLDNLLRPLIVTPWMHWVHHSRIVPETNSNYGSIFSFWDRLFGSFRLRSEPRAIQFGLEGYDQAERQSLWGLLETPFK